MPPPALRACLAPWGATTRRLSGAAASASNPEAGAGSPTGGTQEQPADAEGPLAQGRRMVVKAPAPGGALDNPAAPDAPLPLLQRASQAAQVGTALPAVDLRHPAGARQKAPACRPTGGRAHLQDLLLRPLPETRGRAYHYAEDSARAALAEQQAQGQGLPGDESM